MQRAKERTSVQPLLVGDSSQNSAEEDTLVNVFFPRQTLVLQMLEEAELVPWTFC